MRRNHLPTQHCADCPLSHCPAHCAHGYAQPERAGPGGWLRRAVFLIIGAIAVAAVLSIRIALPHQTDPTATTALAGFAVPQRTSAPPTPAAPPTPTSATVTGNGWDLNERGKAALAGGDQLAAAALFSAAIAADPAYYEPYNNLAFVRYEQGQDDEAIGLWDKALALDPQSADANAGMGVALATRGRGDEAWDYYRRALELNLGYTDVVWMQEQRLWGPRAIMSSAPLRQRAIAP